MIRQVSAYGVMLTDKFGGYLKEYEDLLKAIDNYALNKYLKNTKLSPEKYEEYRQSYGDEHMNGLMYEYWICICPSAGGDQLTLGFESYISRHTNFDEVDKKWNELMEKLPEEVAVEFKKLSISPDIIFMSGKY